MFQEIYESPFGKRPHNEKNTIFVPLSEKKIIILHIKGEINRVFFHCAASYKRVFRYFLETLDSDLSKNMWNRALLRKNNEKNTIISPFDIEYNHLLLKGR